MIASALRYANTDSIQDEILFSVGRISASPAIGISPGCLKIRPLIKKIIHFSQKYTWHLLAERHLEHNQIIIMGNDRRSNFRYSYTRSEKERVVITAKNKERLLFLLRYLMDHTDEANECTLNDLARLYEENGTPATRKTIRNDLEKLKQYFDADMPVWKGGRSYD